MLCIPFIILVWMSYIRGDTFQPVSTTCKYWDSLTIYTNGQNNKLHCILDENGIEGIVNTTWILIDPGQCPIFNRHTEQVDKVPCNEDLGRCPNIPIRSYQAIQYNACYKRDGEGVRSHQPSDQVIIHNYDAEDKSQPVINTLVVVLILIIILLVIGLLVTVYFLTRKKYRRSRNQGITEGYDASETVHFNPQGQEQFIQVCRKDIYSLLARYSYNRIEEFCQNDKTDTVKALTDENKVQLAQYLTNKTMQKIEGDKCGISSNTTNKWDSSEMVKKQISDGDNVRLTFNFKAEDVESAVQHMIKSGLPGTNENQ